MALYNGDFPIGESYSSCITMLILTQNEKRYKDIEFVAVGGAGIVGKAKDEVTQKAVVIKKFKDISWGGG